MVGIISLLITAWEEGPAAGRVQAVLYRAQSLGFTYIATWHRRVLLWPAYGRRAPGRAIPSGDGPRAEMAILW